MSATASINKLVTPTEGSNISKLIVAGVGGVVTDVTSSVSFGTIPT